MLPDFTRAKERASRQLFHWARQQVPAGEPLLQGVATFQQHEGKDLSVIRHDQSEGSTGYCSVEAEVVTTREEMKHCDINAIQHKLLKAARQIGRAQTKRMLEAAGEAASSVGNVVDAEGELTPNKYFAMLRKLQIDFDPQTLEPTFVIVMHPKTASWVLPKVKEWEKDPKFKAEYERIMAVKIGEWRDREANRKLVE